jgi:hypothetical protein
VKVIVDTCIWSYCLRHAGKQNQLFAAHRAELIELIKETRVCMLGLVRQEVLSGIKSHDQYLLLRDKLREFPDTELRTEDYELAAEFLNKARSRGIQGSTVDFLLCSASHRLGYPVYTADADFGFYAKCLPVRTYSPRFLQYDVPR